MGLGMFRFRVLTFAFLCLTNFVDPQLKISGLGAQSLEFEFVHEYALHMHAARCTAHTAELCMCDILDARTTDLGT